MQELNIGIIGLYTIHDLTISPNVAYQTMWCKCAFDA